MSESNPERPLDRHLDALIEGGAIRSDAAGASIGSAAARSAAMLHRMLEEPPDADTAPDLTPTVMARIERKAATAPPAPGASPSLAYRLRSALARVALGPVAAAGALAAALAIALFAAGDAPGPLSGAAVGLAAPSLAAVAAVALVIGAAAWWLRRR